MTETQLCNICNKSFQLTTRYFHWRKDSCSFRKTCKKCLNGRKRKGNTGYITKEQSEYVQEIECTKCGSLLPRTKEFFAARENNIFRRTCRKCVRRYYHENKDRISNSQRKYYQNNRDKILTHQKEYIANNIEAIKENSKKRYHANKDRYRERAMRWRFKNKNKIREKQKEYETKRRAEDPAYRLRRNVSRSINGALKRVGSSKCGGSIINALLYSIDELKYHLESLFEPWMNWDNYGVYRASDWDDNNQSTWTWQIDHVDPQSTLLYDSMDHPSFFKCWALENLRPLSSKINLLEGANRIRHTE